MQNNVGIYASQISGHLWAPNGAYDALATITVPSGGVASVTFAGIPQGYKHLQIRSISRSTNTSYNGGDGDWIGMRFNGDSGSNYSPHYIQGNGANTFANGYTTSRCVIQRGANANTGANIFGTIVTDVLDYASTSKNKTVRYLGGVDNNGTGQMYFGSNGWYSTSAITSIELVPEIGNFVQYSQFALYGVK